MNMHKIKSLLEHLAELDGNNFFLRIFRLLKFIIIFNLGGSLLTCFVV